MKVVLFCGGYGMRMRSADGDLVPKPLQMVGPRPLLWHVMRYYAHYGHTEFILCLGYGQGMIKDFFLNYRETESNNFVMRGGHVELLDSDMSEWTITFVDTGLESPIGERLRRVRNHLGDDPYFLANYADVLTDAPLDTMIERFHAQGAAASMLVVPPQSSFHCVDVSTGGDIKEIAPIAKFPIWVNGGYFVLSQEVIDLIPENGDLVGDACMTLAGTGRLLGYEHDGFWKPADTFKERAELDADYNRGIRPWAVWETAQATGRSA
ncbi:glucose-1-phosphate cytidylyltransferase [Mycobacterium kubicae]|uniref:Glucose-1-phosphate cytidylyltransferase n=1 Tax=Mycobacterium kubicae TaxID=120959 RepID=A0AAX1J942_9MYCO|nr:glucose-1-phosphate cytidylyltransferase [Mycobacterium kubicae]MCV7097539.1 glucose-1-phosphate cytidylyltransferase [Mycobacterium kubicae]ORV96630.1 glucose-1-phosphate cytidylyltransferase [Mycobacterium kubicae]QNI13421.1 glucose-1-phosphate cytidylyltransferase [Mycobacterium kubicae]QPI36941.1 glucose-1-phosphate cytidylyltransferase [Mycobacterium kubicae]GFG67022.1 glucose-1-phosphate cytidylyltransferase [Mycobacterium kubicae]